MIKASTIVIPVYKSKPTRSDIMSFNQCLKVLFQHKICLITYRGLDISFYTDLMRTKKVTCQIEYFDKECFENLAGYNRLMLSFEFYKRFEDFQYILIYQLDSWVFRDDLDYWCNKGYDYIGAPWFENFGCYEDGNKLWIVGNGGFSLRRIPAFLNIFYCEESFFTISEFKEICSKQKDLIAGLKRVISVYIRHLGVKHNNSFLMRKWAPDEDTFWSQVYQNSKRPLKIPNCEEVIGFSFEKSPGYLYELNGRKLPFGCHAWEKHDYHAFWKDFIFEQD